MKQAAAILAIAMLVPVSLPVQAATAPEYGSHIVAHVRSAFLDRAPLPTNTAIPET